MTKGGRPAHGTLRPDFDLSLSITWHQILLEQIAGGLERPLHITHAGDASGRVRVDPFLDIEDRVKSDREQGLLCVAFPPENSGKVR
jgi:hypothetical protein